MKKYFALFFAAVLVFNACKKDSVTPGPPAGSEYTSHMGGARNWNVHHRTNICPTYGVSVDTSYVAGNAVTIVNDTVISFNSSTLKLSAFDAVNKTVTFCYAATLSYSYDSLTYYYVKDSMKYTAVHHVSVCDIEYDDFSTR